MIDKIRVHIQSTNIVINLSIFCLFLSLSFLVEAEVTEYKTKRQHDYPTKVQIEAELEKKPEKNWRIIDDAPYQIIPASAPLKATGETLAQLGFNNRDELLASIENRTVYRSVAFSPDGRYIVSGSDDNTVKLWDIEKRTLAHTFEGHTSYVNSVAISTDGRFIVSGSGDATIKLWDIENRTLTYTFEGHIRNVNSVAFSTDGRFIVSGSGDSSIKLWGIQNQTLLHTLEGHTRSVQSVAFSTDGRFIASGSNDSTVKLWDIQNQKLIHTFEGHNKYHVFSVAFSPDGRFVASGSADSTVKLWDLQNQRLAHTFEGHSTSVNSVAISPDGRFIASGSHDFTVKLWDIQNQAPLYTFDGYSRSVNSVAFSLDGRFIASGSADNTIKFWDIQNQTYLHTFEGNSRRIYSVAFSIDGRFIASGSSDNTIKLWDMQNQILAHTFKADSRNTFSVTFSPDGRFIASGSAYHIIELWDIHKQKLIHSFEGHNNRNVNSVAFSPDGRFIASGSDDSSVKLWDIQNQTLLHTFEGHTSVVTSVAFSPDGRSIASGSGDNTVKLWDIQNQTLLHTFESHTRRVNSVVFSPDGRFIASGSGDNTVKLWDIQNQTLAQTFKGHTRSITSVAFSPDGRFIASGSTDYTVKLWDIQNQTPVHTFEGHAGNIHSVAFNSDGRFIGSASYDGTVKLWDVQTKANEMTLISPEVDNWLLIKNDLVIRSEHGNLLRKKADNNDWMPVLPVDMKPRSDFSISINPAQYSISAGQGKEAELSVDIQNNGPDAVFWLKLKPTQSDDGVVRLDTPDNQLKAKGQSVFKASHITRLEAGDTISIHARVSTNLAFPSAFIQPGLRQLPVTVVSANGTEASLTIDVDVNLPQLEWQQATVQPDGSSLSVLLKNTGTAVFNAADVQLVADGLSQIQKQTIPVLEPDQFIELAFVLPGQANLLYLFKLLFNPDSLQLQGVSNQLPVFSWQMKATHIFWVLPWLLAVFFILSLFAIFYIRRYRHPLVIELSSHPDKLQQLRPEQLAEAYQRLDQTQLLKTVLSKSEVSVATVLNSIDFFAAKTSVEKIHYLENRLGCKAKNIQNNLWDLPLPPNFPLNLNRCLVYIPTIDIKAADVFNVVKAMPETTRTTTLLIGPDSDYQRQLYAKSRDPANKWVSPTGVELTQLMLNPEPEMVLAKILASQLSLTLLSPYQLGGGVNSESVFFGRQQIIDHILNREPANYLLAGGRQLGKSSLLKALERRFQEQGDVICFYIALSSEVLIPRLISLLKLPKDTRLDELAAYAEKAGQRLVFLIDEADKFIRQERSHGYQILNTLRQVSEEGRCHFILAGFWELFQHAVWDYQSPLKNFAETIQIGALEAEACRKLATVPMQTMGIEYAKPVLVDQLLQTTGGRANLIAIVCHQLIENLASDQRIISEDDLTEALHSEKTLNALRGWGAMTDEENACRLDRIIVYTTVASENFTLEQLLEMLKQHQIKLNMEMIEQSLARLVLGFVLGRVQKRHYIYQVPLFQEMIINESPSSKLAIEIEEWNTATKNPD